MDFTYASLKRLIDSLHDGGYDICGYHNWEDRDKCAILRHDVDYDPSKSLELATKEASWGVTSTYFFLLTSPLYNAQSQKCIEIMQAITSFNHEIGLHFDEACYPQYSEDPHALIGEITREAGILSEAIGNDVRVVSMHRPSQNTLHANLKVPGIINSYGDEFFKGFKYLSDSRRRWREPVEEIVANAEFKRLHILTHAFWYSEYEKSIEDAVASYVNRACMERYKNFSANITDMDKIMRENEVLGWQ